MKSIYKYALLGVVTLSLGACQDFEGVNVNPNSPTEVPTHMLMSGAQKRIFDDVYDEWFSGRQCLLYPQYWAQRNYTEEDRYQIRETTNNGYFNYLYQGVGNLMNIEELNTTPETAAANSAFGANCNQIAAAKILKVWLMTVITNTWGNVPYTDAGKLKEGVLYCKYDDQKEIYAGLIQELTDAVEMIDESQPAFTSGDNIYHGDASKWKKLGNSLKCRLAVHTSKVDPNWKKHIEEALASGVMQSNEDAAKYKYSTSGSDYCILFEAYFVDNRNDFTMAKPFMDILKGQADTLNTKSHPWEGTVDPRLPLFTTSSGGEYKGFAYGVPSANAASAVKGTPSWYFDTPFFLKRDFSVPIMTYAEMKFIESEYNNYSAAEYEAGVRASLSYWGELAGSPISQDDADAYVASVTQSVDAEAVAVQKYIDLYLNGTEAWTEIRRTGYPEQLIRPGEISGEFDGEKIQFTTMPTSDTKGDIISRVKYPTNESTLNGKNWDDAVSRLQDGTNNYYSKMFWDVRSDSYDHPANL